MVWLIREDIKNNYINTVKQAINDDYTFSDFKNNLFYLSVVGMSDDKQAEIWLNKIRECPDIFSKLDVFSRNDIIGNPSLWTSSDGITISPNTLHYINTLREISESFEFEGPINVLELGVGYGGLCYILSNFYNINSYCLVDLPDVQTFAAKYLSKLGVNNLTFEPTMTTDLFISEYCLSEFDDTQMDTFYEQYIVESMYIYLLMNLHDKNRRELFLNKLSNHFCISVSDEFPKPNYPNFVVKGVNYKN